tara:strand:- start:59 stop:352 length:294 start_codon:yes stop_codon:yes gene_type:complete
MKLKKSRYERECRECKAVIKRGDQYGQKAITLRSGKDEDEDTSYNDMYITLHELRVTFDFCKCCCIKKKWVQPETPKVKRPSLRETQAMQARNRGGY